MKIEVTGRIALVSDYSPQEEEFLKKHLSWGELSYERELDEVPYGIIPITRYEEPGRYQKEKRSITILLAKLEDGRIYTIKHALFYVIEKYGDDLGLDKSVIPQRESELSNLGKIDPSYLPGITLRDYQEKTINKALAFGSGIIKSAVGSGKTEMQIALAGYTIDNKISEYVLIICPSLTLVDNFCERCSRYSVNAQKFVSGCSLDESVPIIVANIDAVRNQLRKNKEYVHILKKCSTIIFDEAHHLRADTFYQVVVTINPKHLYEFSGTPFQDNDFHSNYQDFLVYALCGRILSSVSTNFLISRGYLAQPYFLMIPIGKKKSPLFVTDWHVVEKNFIIKNEERNKQIIEWTKLFVKYEMKLLILVQKIEHMDYILKKISEFCEVIGVRGSNSGRMYDPLIGSVEEFPIDYTTTFNMFKEGEYQVLVASQVVDEGVDLPACQAVLLCGGSKSFIKTNQRVGRGLRAKKGSRNEVFILDFMDNGHNFVRKHSILRREHFLSMGAIELSSQEFVDRIYQNYLDRKNQSESEKEQ